MALEQIVEALGLPGLVPNRLRRWRSIPTNWEDITVSGYKEGIWS